MSLANINLTAQCLCKSQTFTTPLPLTGLPLKATACHCTSCRHVTGALRGSCDTPWPGPSLDITESTLKQYRFSANVVVLFCGACGTGLFFEEVDQHPQAGVSYGVFTGVLSLEGDGLGSGQQVVKYVDQCFVGDTKDGGAAVWLRGVNGPAGEEVRVWLGRRGESQEVKAGEQWPALGELPGHEVDLKRVEGEAGNVPIRCHCGGVDFVLRAGDAQREFAERQDKGEEIPWFVDPGTHKLLGTLDGCNTCRVWNGAEVFNWTFSLVKHFSFAGNEPGFPGDAGELRAAVEAKDVKPRDARLGTLAVYASSPDVQRYFCGRCSASVFYACDDRPDLLDVAVGLLDSPDGARAESVISWELGKVGWREDMVGTWRVEVLAAAEKGSEQWRMERGYPKSWRRIAREQAAVQTEGK